MASTSQSPSRDQRLDFWRGLCLIDMVLVHLYYQNVQFGDFLGQFLGNYTRFAAGGFIFVSGLSIGVIFWPRVQDDRRRTSTYKSLWRRSVYILGVHYLSAMVLIAMEIVRGLRGNFNNPLAILQDVFLLREGGDLLPFYVMMIALSPFLMQAFRLKWGWLGVLIASVSFFIYGLWHPWTFAPAQHLTFPPILWQMIFILGLLLGWAWPKYNALTNAKKTMIATLSWFITATLFVMEYGYQWGMPQLSLGLTFAKVPLSAPETLRYLSITLALITTTDVLWPHISDLSAAAFVQTLGRKSLPVYVLHLWVVEAVGALAVSCQSMGAWQIIFAIVSILILWLFALILDLSNQAKSPRPPTASRARIFSDPFPSGAR